MGPGKLYEALWLPFCQHASFSSFHGAKVQKV